MKWRTAVEGPHSSVNLDDPYTSPVELDWLDQVNCAAALRVVIAGSWNLRFERRVMTLLIRARCP